MAEGTKDVSADLQKRTDLKPADKILMVNSETQEVQYMEVEQINEQATLATFTDQTFDI
jgi:hypothetical protein